MKKTIMYGLSILVGTWLGIQGLHRTAELIMPESLPKIKDVNKDGLPDLVYPAFEKKYRIYLQQKDGNYIPKAFVDAKEKHKLDSIYNARKRRIGSVYQQQKTRLDSVYRARQDSLKKVYENKLEKGVQ